MAEPGWATVYGILTQASGDIRINSEPGHGTTFTVMLPVTSEGATPPAEPVPYRRTPKGETVLVVEDEAALREVTRRIFSRNGYKVITAASGPEALGIARSHPGDIHLLVTDVVMPQMLGKEVAESMRLIKPGIEVIFMSGYARPVLASQGRLDPGVALVEKPFSEAALLATAGSPPACSCRANVLVQAMVTLLSDTPLTVPSTHWTASNGLCSIRSLVTLIGPVPGSAAGTRQTG